MKVSDTAPERALADLPGVREAALFDRRSVYVTTNGRVTLRLHWEITGEGDGWRREAARLDRAVRRVLGA